MDGLLDGTFIKPDSQKQNNSLSPLLLAAYILFALGQKFIPVLYSKLHPNSLYSTYPWAETVISLVLPLLALLVVLLSGENKKNVLLGGLSVIALCVFIAVTSDVANGMPLTLVFEFSSSVVFYSFIYFMLYNTPFMGYVQRVVLLTYACVYASNELFSYFMYLGSDDTSRTIVTLYGAAFIITSIVLVVLYQPTAATNATNIIPWLKSHMGTWVTVIVPFILLVSVVCFMRLETNPYYYQFAARNQHYSSVLTVFITALFEIGIVLLTLYVFKTQNLFMLVGLPVLMLIVGFVLLQTLSQENLENLSWVLGPLLKTSGLLCSLAFTVWLCKYAYLPAFVLFFYCIDLSWQIGNVMATHIQLREFNLPYNF